MNRDLITQSHFESAARSLINAYRSPHTRQAYGRDLEEWLRFCSLIQVEPAHPTLDAASAFRDKLSAAGSPNSARRALAALSSIYRKLLAARIVAGNPFHPAMLSWPPGNDAGKTAAVSDRDAEAMIACAGAESLRDRALLRLLYDTGIRRGSAVKIARAALAVHGGILTARVVVKGGREVEIELPEQTAEAVRSWIAVAPLSLYLFPNARGSDGPMHISTVNKIVDLYAEKAGVEKVHPHSFRAAFVTAAYDAGLHEREIQAAVHHADPQTTRKYDRGARGGRVAEAIAEKRRGGK